MYKSLIIFIIGTFLFIGFNTGYCFAQEYETNQNNKVVGDQTGHSKELILGAAKATDKNLSILTTAISQITGLQFISFCSKHKLVLITFDKNLFKGPKEVIEAIKNKNFTMPLVEKQGTFSDINEMCK